MAKKKQEPEKERIIPNVCFCRNCINGGEIQDYKSWCEIKKIWQHSPVRCTDYDEK